MRRDRTEIAATTLLERIEKNTAPTIIDVRSEQEFVSGHVPRALNIPFHRIGRQLDRIPGSKCDAVVVYCGHGPRAWIAAVTLRRHGFTDIKYLAGHFRRWRAARLREER